MRIIWLENQLRQQAALFFWDVWGFGVVVLVAGGGLVCVFLP